MRFSHPKIAYFHHFCVLRTRMHFLSSSGVQNASLDELSNFLSCRNIFTRAKWRKFENKLHEKARRPCERMRAFFCQTRSHSPSLEKRMLGPLVLMPTGIFSIISAFPETEGSEGSKPPSAQRKCVFHTRKSPIFTTFAFSALGCTF